MIKDLIFMGQIPEQLTREERRYKIFVDSYQEKSDDPNIEELRSCIRKIENSLDIENYEIETSIVVTMKKRIEKSFDSIGLEIEKLLSQGSEFYDEIEFLLPNTLFVRSRIQKGVVFKFDYSKRESFIVDEVSLFGNSLKVKVRLNTNSYVKSVKSFEFGVGRKLVILPNVQLTNF